MAGNISDQTTVLSNLSLQGKFQLGGATGIAVLSVQTFAVAAITAVATKSTTTNATISGLSTVDLCVVIPTSSGLSNGLALNAYPTAVDTLTLNFSNCSTANVVQAAGTYRLAVIR